ncbi:hypothetical protein V502_07345 [Pseudogymnoascus sp. VKM F-4520 (FW-2644)]|nr:hypothetical protein V502_07345 [Pseudogymnoascus sp. VKM F-4520 (FW-2644)]
MDRASSTASTTAVTVRVFARCVVPLLTQDRLPNQPTDQPQYRRDLGAATNQPTNHYPTSAAQPPSRAPAPTDHTQPPSPPPDAYDRAPITSAAPRGRKEAEHGRARTIGAYHERDIRERRAAGSGGRRGSGAAGAAEGGDPAGWRSQGFGAYSKD